MGEELASSYLRSKLSAILKEAEADSGSSSAGIISRIKSLKDDYPMIPVDGLHELIESVSKCRVFGYTTAVSKKGWLDFPKLLGHPLSKLMFNIRMRNRLDSIEKKLRSTPPPQPLARRVLIEQTHPIEDLSHIIGFDAEAERIEAWLLPQEEEEAAAWRAVGIVGTCGCGKTALAQKVFASPRIKEEFWPRIWVCLSSNEERVESRARVLSHILKEIGHDVSEEEESYEQLRERLERGLKGQRYLIVLDNAWPRDKGGELFLPKESGGAVIVTSRLGKAIGEMVGDDLEHVIRVEPQLSHEICWQIFTQVFQQQQQQQKVDLEDIKLAAIEDDLKRNIDRLPLAAKTMGTILPGLLLKNCWMRARDIRITWGNDTRYWRWTSLPPPQQEEVAELLDICWLDIKVTVTMKKFLLKTSYSAYLVFKLDKYSRGLDTATGRLKIFRKDNLESDQACTLFINYWKDNNAEEEEEEVVQYYPQVRVGEEGNQGWMEIKLGDFVTTSEFDGRSVEPAFEVITSDWKSGLVVKGIEIRPNYPPTV